MDEVYFETFQSLRLANIVIRSICVDLHQCLAIGVLWYNIISQLLP